MKDRKPTRYKSDNTREKLPRLDRNQEVRAQLLPHCRLAPGEVWTDPVSGHRVGVLDGGSPDEVATLMTGDRAQLAVHDPPYNLNIGGTSSVVGERETGDYVESFRRWIESTLASLDDDGHFYTWLGADVRRGFQPLPEVLFLFREFPELSSRNYITLRNQRGYGTQKNWMWVRQELLHYIRGNPPFEVVYTEIPKVLKGYYKKVKGAKTENIERGRSPNIRPGNVWIDIQQVFYRREENVPGCYAQKPLAALERIVLTSSRPHDLVIDFFSHSGTTLVAGEKTGRKVYTMDIDPVFAELTIRRLERFRETGKTGWQWYNPFPEWRDEL